MKIRFVELFGAQNKTNFDSFCAPNKSHKTNRPRRVWIRFVRPLKGRTQNESKPTSACAAGAKQNDPLTRRTTSPTWRQNLTTRPTIQPATRRHTLRPTRSAKVA